MNQPEVEHDAIDEALISLIAEVLGESASDDEIEDASSVIFSIIEDMEDSGEVQMMPDDDSSPEQQESWLKTDFPKIKERCIAAYAE